MNFKELNVADDIIKALEYKGYENPTPIQEQAIPEILAGKDILGCAQTGTGKTAAFAVPTIQKLAEKKSPDQKNRSIKALVLSPTRELATQIHESFNDYSKYVDIKTAVIFGGVSQNPQVRKLRAGVDIVVATPGRLVDLMNQKMIDLRKVEIFILDEADLMLDMGFITDINIIKDALPAEKQSLLFSATMPKEINDIATSLMSDPVKIAVERISSPVKAIKQVLYYTDADNKRPLMTKLLKEEQVGSVLVFARTKRNVDNIVRNLKADGIEADGIHGDKTQAARQRVLKMFKDYKIQVLVATDIAARGIDIDSLSCVINYNIPEEAETYVHRIGRTGRAGEEGLAITLCDHSEKTLLAAVERLLDDPIPVIEEHDFPLVDTTVEQKGKGRRRNTRKKPSTANRARTRSNSSSRDGARSRKPRSEQGSRDGSSNKEGYGSRKPRGEYTKRDSSSKGEGSSARKPYVKRDSSSNGEGSGNRKPRTEYGKRDSSSRSENSSNRKPYGKKDNSSNKEGSGSRKPYGKKDSSSNKEGFGGRKPYGKKDSSSSKEGFGNRKPYGKKDSSSSKEGSGNRKSYGKKDSSSSKEGSGNRKPYGKKDSSSNKEGYGNRKPYGKKDSSSSSEGSGSRKPRGEYNQRTGGASKPKGTGSWKKQRVVKNDRSRSK